jgi:hypothetical protein
MTYYGFLELRFLVWTLLIGYYYDKGRDEKPELGQLAFSSL